MRANSNTDNEQLLALIDGAIAEAEAVIQPKSIWRIFDCEVTENALLIGDVKFESRRLAENLRGCRRVAVLGATLGTQGDGLLRKYSGESAKLMTMQAVLTAKIEELCDGVQADIERECGCKTRQRYSPGYYDLDIKEQKTLFSLLDITKRCGITLTDSFQMIPTKSVTAFAGIEDNDEQ